VFLPTAITGPLGLGQRLGLTANLANDLGNLLQRTTSMFHRRSPLLASAEGPARGRHVAHM